jgi:hypothetical protein
MTSTSSPPASKSPTPSNTHPKTRPSKTSVELTSTPSPSKASTCSPISTSIPSSGGR